MRVTFTIAEDEDAESIAQLQNAAADDLTARFGEGHWSGRSTVKGVRSSMRHAKHVIGSAGGRPVAVARLATRKPWAIDVAYFTPCRRPLYLTGMAVAPAWQRKGVGRLCLDQVIAIARDWPGDAVRLDAWDAPAGAGGFYARCGFAFRGSVVYKGVPHLYYELLLT